MRRTLHILASVSLVGLLGGCLPDHQAPIEAREPATPAERNFQTLWRACDRTLKDYRFPVDRKDPRAGVMTTEAVVAGHLFEFWRKDATSNFAYQENTVQNILRGVKVTILPIEGTDQFDFQVDVRMARTNRLEPAITDASQFRTVAIAKLPEVLRYSDLLPGANDPANDPLFQERLEDARIRGEILPDQIIIPLGRDSELERRIARDIRRRAGLPEVSVVTQSSEDLMRTPAPEQPPAAPTPPADPTLVQPIESLEPAEPIEPAAPRTPAAVTPPAPVAPLEPRRVEPPRLSESLDETSSP